jgi:S-adenosylmethionine-diacylglycerol 3-amino-3-carboxypropyl transferase
MAYSISNNNNHLTKRPFFKKIAYSTCWEDYDIIQEALKINKEDVLLSISSAGCNILNLLLHNPKKILAVDFNPNQNYLLELKIKAIKNLDYQEFIELLGIVPSNRREKIYDSIKNCLNKDARAFWNKNINLIKKGITYNGRQERYIQTIGRYLRFFKGEDTIKNLFKCKTPEEQIEYFKRNIEDFIWHGFFNVIYSKPVMFIVKDRLVFSQVSGNSYNTRFKERVERALSNNPIKNNPFASLALLGYYLNEDYYPPYLKKDNFPILKERVDRIEIKTTTLQRILKELPSNSFTKFNLSNVLDWVDIKEFKDTLREIARVGKHGSRFCYFNTLIRRGIPKDIRCIKSHKKLADKLLKKDKAFLYGNFEIGEIIKEEN